MIDKKRRFPELDNIIPTNIGDDKEELTHDEWWNMRRRHAEERDMRARMENIILDRTQKKVSK